MRKWILLSLMALTITAVPIAVVGSSPASAAPSCTLANGVQHVVEITFDNVHFFRDHGERSWACCERVLTGPRCGVRRMGTWHCNGWTM